MDTLKPEIGGIYGRSRGLWVGWNVLDLRIEIEELGHSKLEINNQDWTKWVCRDRFSLNLKDGDDHQKKMVLCYNDECDGSWKSDNRVGFCADVKSDIVLLGNKTTKNWSCVFAGSNLKLPCANWIQLEHVCLGDKPWQNGNLFTQSEDPKSANWFLLRLDRPLKVRGKCWRLVLSGEHMFGNITSLPGVKCTPWGHIHALYPTGFGFNISHWSRWSHGPRSTNHAMRLPPTVLTVPLSSGVLGKSGTTGQDEMHQVDWSTGWPLGWQRWLSVARADCST